MFFLEDYGIRPEELRKMFFYDVYMLRYAAVARHINKVASKAPNAAPASGLSSFFTGG